MTDIRRAIVDEAMSWLNTPYHSHARVKGAGVDCAQILIGVYSAVGLIEPFDPGWYAPDFHLHRSEEVYLGWIEKFCDRLPEDAAPLPGDIALYRFGRCVSHAAIVVQWPTIIHSYIGQGVRLGDSHQEGLERRLHAIYRPHVLKDV